MLNCNIWAAIWGLLSMLCHLRRTIREKPGVYSQSVAVRKKKQKPANKHKKKTKQKTTTM